MVVAATLWEAVAVRRAVGGAAHVERAGIALRRPSRSSATASVVISCGVCGSLTPDLRPGTLVVPDVVVHPEGRSTRCDVAVTEALRAAARRLGAPVHPGPLLTSRTLLVGPARGAAAEATGCVAVDMETALLADRRPGSPLAAVRAVLDSPDQEISADWAHPVAVLLHPWLWPEGVRLAVRTARLSRAAAMAAADVVQAWARVTSMPR